MQTELNNTSDDCYNMAIQQSIPIPEDVPRDRYFAANAGDPEDLDDPEPVFEAKG